MKRIVVLALLLAAHTAGADDTRAEWQLGRGDSPHAGMPFELDLVVAGFDEQPQPDQPKLDIPDAAIKPLGVQPNVSRSIQIINGRRSDSTNVTWVLRWSVTPAKEGRLKIPTVTVAQGSRKATAHQVEATVEAVPTTDSMKLELALPARPVFVGENIPVTLTWLFRAAPQRDPTFQVPMLDSDAFTVGTPPATNQHTYQFAAGGKVLDLPYQLDQVDVGGQQYNRLVATFYAAPKKTGKIDVPAASVVVALPVGRPDFFGGTPSRLFRTTDVPHTLEVKPLPETDRPLGFAGAVGTQFSMAVATSRSVVSLGEPVELAITVKSDQRLDTLALPRLDGQGGLPKDQFSVPAEAPTGEVSADGKTKTFKVTVQVTGQATEIPALAFSYFDPVKGTYQTVHSDPIALSVKGGAIVGANDVISATPARKAAAAPADTDLALVGADLALSAPGAADSEPLHGALLWLLVGLLYAIPLALLALRTWQLRTRDRREEAAEVRTARKKLEDLLARAERDPARDTAGPLAAALRAFARTLEREPDDGGLLAQIETESFAPGASASPLSAEVRVRARELIARWSREARKPPRRPVAATAVVLLAALAGARTAAAQPSTSEPPSVSSSAAFDQAREAYEQAMALTAPSARRTAFARAQAALGRIAAEDTSHPELLADWGNAALGAGDVATATLAYRRALAIDGSNPRARKNLAWLRGRQPEALRPGGDTATAP
ncbi:MAG: BatD family protein [Acidobacteriota bacterium]